VITEVYSEGLVCI